MKVSRCLALLFGLVAGQVCSAATINLTTPGVVTSLNLHYNSTIAGSSNFNSSSAPGNLVATLDDTADTGKFASADLGVVTPGFNRTFQHAITTITHPTNFPDPPIVVTETFTETITIDPVSLPLQLASSTTAPIGYQEFLQLYSFSSNVGLSFPDTITVSGTYQVEGPTETITRTFSIPFQRTGSGAFNANWIGFVRVGANYPETGRMGAINYSFYPVYTPTSATIFEGTVDGFSLTARFSAASTRVTLPMPVPETVSVLPWLVSLPTLLSIFLQRSDRGRVS